LNARPTKQMVTKLARRWYVFWSLTFHHQISVGGRGSSVSPTTLRWIRTFAGICGK
jgi:hypothetical protein